MTAGVLLGDLGGGEPTAVAPLVRSTAVIFCPSVSGEPSLSLWTFSSTPVSGNSGAWIPAELSELRFVSSCEATNDNFSSLVGTGLVCAGAAVVRLDVVEISFGTLSNLVFTAAFVPGKTGIAGSSVVNRSKGADCAVTATRN